MSNKLMPNKDKIYVIARSELDVRYLARDYNISRDCFVHVSKEEHIRGCKDGYYIRLYNYSNFILEAKLAERGMQEIPIETMETLLFSRLLSQGKLTIEDLLDSYEVVGPRVN